jgi:hypothetical protein
MLKPWGPTGIEDNCDMENLNIQHICVELDGTASTGRKFTLNLSSSLNRAALNGCMKCCLQAIGFDTDGLILNSHPVPPGYPDSCRMENCFPFQENLLSSLPVPLSTTHNKYLK